MKMTFPRSSHNWITLIGATIAFIALSMIVFLFAISTILREGHTYLGLVIFILLPAVMIFGLLLIPLGMLIERRRLNRSGVIPEEASWPRVDLNDIRHRNAFFIFTAATTFLLFASAVGSYEAFHFTESNTFCGTVCHDVMHPEFTAYQHSPHARVACVDCHVGSGADWYVRSKLSGAYQVYSTMADKYPRPIPTPINNLRPASETCMQCHWPEKFYARKQRLSTYYLSDEENSAWNLELLMKIGGESSAAGLSEGIHWHINPDVQIDYIATDKQRMEIPWVRYTNTKTGEVTIYRDEDADFDDDSLAAAETRTMDCMDCHNRPSHEYRSPGYFINQAITTGELPRELPEIKSIAADLCAEEYGTHDSAMAAISGGIREFYEDDYPELLESRPELIEQAISGLQEAFAKNIFPEMKVRWSAYPNHIGHLDFDGCFRCHNDRHQSEDGIVIKMDCNLCHTITAQGPPDSMTYAARGAGLPFAHPDGDDEDWKDGLCTDCHEGLNP